MAENLNSTTSFAKVFIPVFNGEGFEHWSIRMKTILKSKELWDVVFLDITATEDNQLREAKRKDALDMAFIQQEVHDLLFSRIASCDFSKQTWETLQGEFQGDPQLLSVKLQGLRRDFENLIMKGDETIGNYFSIVMDNLGRQRSYGEELPDQKVIEMVLCSLTPKYDHVIPSIELANDSASVTPVKLMGLLQSQ
ncbi:uncharacterized protein LOC143593985 [Bidens hawaiensis]|uniref:uncharacterized protein LOC143593985 n=1 Tax=Bidens hawaiensis TaxID=980011 RepID=UPI00404A5625